MSDEEKPVAETGGSQSNSFINPMIIYVLYIASVLVGLTSIVGVIFAYMAEPADDIEKSHYKYQIRTFWIGLLFAVIGIVLTAVLVGILILLATLVWWLIRSIKGFMLWDKKQPIPDPETWLW